MGLLREVLAPDDPVFLIMTAHGTIRSAVDAMPFDNDELRLVLERALERRALERRVVSLESLVEERFSAGKLVEQPRGR